MRLLAEWLREERGEEAARPFAEHARRTPESFNRRFWAEERGYLLDVVDGEHDDEPPEKLYAHQFNARRFLKA